MADSIFDATDPFALTSDWLAEAEASEPNDPNAMALATVDADGMPDVRIVLLKEVERDAFVFFTNLDSAKGRQIAATGQAALVLHWKTLRRQVRARGDVERVPDAQADAYYASRPLGSRLGAWASRQSRPLDGRQTLVDAVEDAKARFGDDPPRPDFWGGFRIRPRQIEFWKDGEYRLHDRERWSRDGAGWTRQRLYP
ncbi:PdxH [Oceaniovalibus guishaninsula JLT2003]|uniref:Pyridoxine/pyridoxamine 5'-phosphate oxidase n=1 Tax=Oceaniovalibus guishaninsula JLT2003 TaxID=1231392 RepID=K2GNH9_9RHOB|nr:pyridoxamine 5'-phosphate oxidase [Oceaniovalibus guishaninsula]EKE44176.1 PdxH [Oceaniovalibus guishaninsula JLT2003]